MVDGYVADSFVASDEVRAGILRSFAPGYDIQFYHRTSTECMAMRAHVAGLLSSYWLDCPQRDGGRRGQL